MNRTPKPPPTPRTKRTRRVEPLPTPEVPRNLDAEVSPPPPAATHIPARPALEVEPQPAKVRVPTAFDVFGHVEEWVECEDPTAIAHWDANAWHEVGR